MTDFVDLETGTVDDRPLNRNEVLATWALDAASRVALPGTAPSRVLANADKYLDWLKVRGLLT